MIDHHLRRCHLALVTAALIAGCATMPDPAPVDTSNPAGVDAPAAAEPASNSAPLPMGVASAPLADAAPAEPPVAVDPLRPEVRIDPNDADAKTDLWERIRRGYKMTNLNNKLVRQQEQWYAARPDYVARMTERGGRYLFHVVEEVEKRGMPTELALLPFIESAFNPEAMSVAAASGMWQFIPSTGRNYDLRQNVFRDDRRNVLASTRAALDYLAKLYGMFGDWHLALAAYNWGEGNVQRAIARNAKARKPTDYASLMRMPNETQNYVPKLQAVKNIVTQPQAYSLTLPPLENHPYFLSVPIERDMDVVLAARLAAIELDEFRALNPQMNKPVILAAGTPQILLPYDNANRFVRALPEHKGPLASWTAWVAPKTMRPSELAKHVGMDEELLRDVNRIPQRVQVVAGSTLVVPRDELRSQDVAGNIAENGSIAFASDGPATRRVMFKVTKSESVASVAKRYRVSAAQVAQWNGVSAGTTFAAGHTVIVHMAQKPNPKAGTRSASVRTSKDVSAKRRSR